MNIYKIKLYVQTTMVNAPSLEHFIIGDFSSFMKTEIINRKTMHNEPFYHINRIIVKTSYEEMAKKTVLKRLITKWAPKSIEMQRMAMFDQAVVNGNIEDIDNANVVYADNQKEERHERGEVTDFEEVDTETGEVKQEQDVQPKENNNLDF